MTGFAMILGGAVKGYGAGVLESARAKREAALQAIAEERADRRLAEDRKLRSEENEKERVARSDELDKGGDLLETDNGYVRVNRKGEATPVTSADKKPVTKKKDMPTAEEFNKMVEDATKTEFKDGLSNPTPQEVDAARSRNRARLRQEFGFDPPKVMAPPVPRDKAKLKVGQEYTTVDGKTVRWTEEGDFEVVP